jgi:hypothetical protein
MTSTQAQSKRPARFRPTIGWLRWSFGAVLLTVILGFVAVLGLHHSLPHRTIAIMLAGWVIPFAILIASLRSGSSNNRFERSRGTTSVDQGDGR